MNMNTVWVCSYELEDSANGLRVFATRVGAEQYEDQLRREHHLHVTTFVDEYEVHES